MSYDDDIYDDFEQEDDYEDDFRSDLFDKGQAEENYKGQAENYYEDHVDEYIEDYSDDYAQAYAEDCDMEHHHSPKRNYYRPEQKHSPTNIIVPVTSRGSVSNVSPLRRQAPHVPPAQATSKQGTPKQKAPKPALSRGLKIYITAMIILFIAIFILMIITID